MKKELQKINELQALLELAKKSPSLGLKAEIEIKKMINRDNFPKIFSVLEFINSETEKTLETGESFQKLTFWDIVPLLMGQTESYDWLSVKIELDYPACQWGATGSINKNINTPTEVSLLQY